MYASSPLMNVTVYTLIGYGWYDLTAVQWRYGLKPKITNQLKSLSDEGIDF